MGTWAARKLARVVENLRAVLAVELLEAAQGVEMRRPLRSSPPLERAVAVVRERVPALGADRFLHPDIAAAAALLEEVTPERMLAG
jgi:histidine ammonia-lyase